jgi:hypothetical protein
MRLLTRPVAPVPTQRPAPPRYVVHDVGGRTDLTCCMCGKQIAFGVSTSTLDADAEFYLEAHAPFCFTA